MANNIVIRPMEESDAAALWEVVAGMADSRDGFVQRVAQKRLLTDHFIPVAVVGEKLVGYAWVHDYGPHVRTGHSTARFNDLIVDPAWRKQGVGRHLFEAVKQWCAARGVRWMQWQASPRAVAFYERLGLKGDPCPDPEYPFFEIDFQEGT
jgi:GNAT superfamily N-acetyltransferase